MPRQLLLTILRSALALALLTLNSCEDREPTPDWRATSHSKSHPTEPSPTPSTEASDHADDSERITFMYYNIRNYLTMRRGNEERPKPEEEIQALIHNIKRVKPDILAVCEIGAEKDLADLHRRLKNAGIDLPHTYLTMGSDPTRRQAILSRFSIEPHSVPKRTYRMKGQELEVKRGILDASVKTPKGTFRFIGAHLKSKRPSKMFDHDLVRRNEALILRKHINSLLKGATPKLLVYGDLNDTKNSPSLRTIKGPYKGNLAIKAIDLRAENGTRWTQHWSYQDIYSRIDFAMTSQQMAKHIDYKKSYILELPKDDPASDHRPLIVILK